MAKSERGPASGPMESGESESAIYESESEMSHESL
jgi:hypothetical protein